MKPLLKIQLLIEAHSLYKQLGKEIRTFEKAHNKSDLR